MVCRVVCGNLSVVGVEEWGREGTVPDSPCIFPCCLRFIMFMRQPQWTLIFSYSRAFYNLHTPVCIIIIFPPTHAHKYARIDAYSHTFTPHTQTCMYTHTHTPRIIDTPTHTYTLSLTLQGGVSHVPSAGYSRSLPRYATQHRL